MNGFKFTVIGDLHYVRDEAHRETLAGRAGYQGEIADLQRYAWARENIFPEIMTAIRREDQPDAVFVLGDAVQGNCDDAAACRREFDDARVYLEQIGSPIHIARGNHDDPEHFAKIFPAAGTPLGRFSYYLRMGGISFFMLDSAEMADAGVYQRVKLALAAIKPGERVFVFAHQPACVVARAFFADRRFLAAARELANIRTVDCWFGGHTHEQIFSRIGPPGHQSLQAVTCVLGAAGETPVPLDFARNLLIARDDYYYGFHENTCPSWLTVIVGDGGVTLSHRSLSGEMGSFRWSTPGDLDFQPAALLRRMCARPAVSDADLRRIRTADLWFAAHNCAGAGKQVFINGALVGELPIAGAYAGHPRLPVPPGLLQRQNLVRITNPAREPCAIGGILIRAVLDDGRSVFSSLSPVIYAYTGKWDPWHVDILKHKHGGEDIVCPLEFSEKPRD